MSAETVIHPLADVSPRAGLGTGVQVGPFAHVGPDVALGDGCVLFPRATVIGHTRLGANCEVHPGSVIGGSPQVMGFEPTPDSRVEIGPGCIFREGTSVHAGQPSHVGTTTIGENCYFMVGSHLAHDGQMGSHCVLSNSAIIGGHVTLGDHVWLAGQVAVHQFTHIGDHAFIGGGSVLVGDVIPFATVIGNRAELAGLNIKGLSRRGFDRARLRALRQGYRAIFESELRFTDAVAAAKADFAANADVQAIIAFIEADRPRPLCLPAKS